MFLFRIFDFGFKQLIKYFVRKDNSEIEHSKSKFLHKSEIELRKSEIPNYF